MNVNCWIRTPWINRSNLGALRGSSSLWGVSQPTQLFLTGNPNIISSEGDKGSHNPFLSSCSQHFSLWWRLPESFPFIMFPVSLSLKASSQHPSLILPSQHPSLLWGFPASLSYTVILGSLSLLDNFILMEDKGHEQNRRRFKKIILNYCCLYFSY